MRSPVSFLGSAVAANNQVDPIRSAGVIKQMASGVSPGFPRAFPVLSGNLGCQVKALRRTDLRPDGNPMTPPNRTIYITGYGWGRQPPLALLLKTTVTLSVGCHHRARQLLFDCEPS
jgi:hypothetical protein